MTEFTIASFNVKNLIGADQEYYRFESYTPEEHAWKQNWLAQQLLNMNADVVCFQEIFDAKSLTEVINEANEAGQALNNDVIPDISKRYHRKAIFKKLSYEAYSKEQLFFAPNVNDGEAGHRRPGLAILSRFGFAEMPEVIQQFDKPVTIEFPDAGYDSDHQAGCYTLERLSRPMIKAKIKIGNQLVTVFNCHLKSKLGEYIKPEGAAFPEEADLTHYLPAQRALGELRAMLRRCAEAYVLRTHIVEELKQGNPVFVLGDFNDSEYSISSAIIKGEKPFKNYTWMRRHNAEHKSDRYSEEEDVAIREQVLRYQLQSAEMQFIKNSQRDMVYTTAFGGVYESIDQILMSQHFLKDSPNAIGEMDYFSVFNDHITNGAHPEAPYNKLASDHGQIMAHIRLF
jgi:endonuclease/exonuclease/phosphatase family metal-dependent hydrolase